MRLWWRIRVLPYTGLLLWPGNDGLRPYERRRMAKRYERTIGKAPNRTRAEVEALLARPADPWDACAAVDPFTGQPDQHEHGDGCESCTD